MLDLPSHDDLVYTFTSFINTPMRLHIVFSYEKIFSITITKSFTSVIEYIYANNVTIINDIKNLLYQFLETLYHNIFVNTDINIILSAWCNITFKRVLEAYDNTKVPEFKKVLDILLHLMDTDEILFFINYVEVADVFKHTYLNISYNSLHPN